ncbi:conserved Plasmodium protein, unknown function [Plasmodium gallinaceum]|uniref:Uncharacterized protein n=1 Tax=Plasmodium gallinaceum TaxID=5849 RepID=A0A1J1GWV2_PLAGA|nr:conserved Plasmodium protein, unknown function [Plasmodium gallinaceum]CRG96798.1 conserved Plasmodium protein, unknown function [Plasmodium gallinaceum]
MEESNPRSGIIISIVFYICYFFYFITYSYEITLIFSKKIDFILFCILLLTTMFSIFFISLALMYASFFLIAIITLTEIYEYTGNLLDFILDDEFNKLFLLVRLFATVNFIVFFSIHISNLKKKKKEYLNKVRSQNNKMELNNKKSQNNNNVLRNNSGPINNNIYNENGMPIYQENIYPPQTITPGGYALHPISNPIIPNEKNILASQLNTYNSQYVPSKHYTIKSPNNLNSIGNNQTLNDYNAVNSNLNLPNKHYINPLNNSANVHSYINDINIHSNEHYLVKDGYNLRNNYYDIMNNPRNNNNLPPFTPNNISLENIPYPNSGSINKNNGTYNAYGC